MNPSSPQLSLPPTKKSHLAVELDGLLGALLLISLIFGFAYFSKANDYKNNVNSKIAVAVTAAQKTQAAALNAKYTAAAAAPYKTFTGSSTYGSITFSYPKTYSAYVDTTDTNEPINGYFYPDTVPGIQSGAAFALRVELSENDYATVVSQYNSQITDGTVTSAAYVPPKMVGVANVTTGTLLTGAISQDATQTGAMLIIKVRDKTLQIYTESPDFESDFNSIVLPSLTFVP